MYITILRSATLFVCLCICLATPSAAAKEKSAPKNAYLEQITGMEFVAIPGGTFVMGNSQDEAASPTRQVTVKPFLLGRYEVTFDQYSKFCDATGRQLPSANGWGVEKRPVINVSKQDAVDFTKWLSEKTGKNFRLPSEAEWEYAAHGGTKTKFPWGDEIGKNRANCNGCGSKWDNQMTAPVGSFPPNGYGLHDVTGNVYEWCLDAYHKDYSGAPSDGSAWLNDAQKDDDINRGGSWFQSANEVAIARRCWDNAGRKSKEYGFRVLLEQ